VAELGLVRSVKPLLLFVFIGIALAAPIGAAPRDPAIGGRSELISPTELKALIAVARQKLAPLGALGSIYRVDILSRVKAKAWYGDQNADSILCLVLERSQTGWRVTGEDGIDRR
jgi:hypothetical protein